MRFEIRIGFVLWAAALGMFLIPSRAAFGQEPEGSEKKAEMTTPQQKPAPVLPKPAEANVSTVQHRWAAQLLKDFAGDQKELWTSPKNLQFTDATWLLPAGGITAGLIVTDSDYSRHISHNPKTTSHYNTFSNAGIAALAGGAGAMWAMSYKNHNSHWRETGFLAGEAALNSLVMIEAVKYSVRRDRPIQGDGTGSFFQSGVSFPSEHSAAAWSIAGVIAHEYPGPLTKILAYGAAGLISYSRVKARKHFPSDVFVGGLVGNLVAQSVYSRHYDPELGGSEWQSASQFFHEHWSPSPESAGSPYVPLDSWVYPAIERLAALGVVHTEFLGMRPWTRLECANLSQEASDNLDNSSENAQVSDLVSALRMEFASEFSAYENGVQNSARVESVYTRLMGIKGTPLTDGYHFGQTIINDNGRPYQEGFNNSTGFSSYATAGRFAIYVSGEYQHAPSAAGNSLAVQQAIANIDHNPVQPVQPIAATNQFTLLNAYLSTNIESWNFSFGRQNLWWSQNYGSSFLYSDNAAPLYMFRLSRVTPFTLPWVFQYLGPMKVDIFFGRPQGHQFPPRPLIHGEKVSFKPTENLELGFSRTVVFGGVGRALTPAAIWNSYVSFTSSFNYGTSNNPGKRNGGFDFSYKLPFVRDWVSLYADSMSPDDPSPVDAPRRAAINPGIHFSRIPGIPRLDLRVEGIYTDVAKSRSNGGQYIYWETFYHDLYTNDKNIIGSWVGREGKGEQAWATYWFGPKSNLQLGYRHQKVASDFIPGGETLHDGSLNLSIWIKRDWNVSTLVQYEQWKAPILAQGLQKNWTSAVEIRFWPHSSEN